MVNRRVYLYFTPSAHDWLVKVQSEALAESSVIVGRVFGQQNGSASYGSRGRFIHGIATSTVQVSYTRYLGTSSQVIQSSIGLYILL